MTTTDHIQAPKVHNQSWRLWTAILFSILGLSFGLAWISSDFQALTGWLSFLAVSILASGFLVAGWLAIRTEKPQRWLGRLMLVAVLIRLSAGVFWFLAMPQWGHGSPAEQAGYIMADASGRDQFAWRLSTSEKPLWTAFQGQRKVDQYGGLLFLSALVYRYLGTNTHQPLMMVVLAAAISALAVPFTWAMARRAWDLQIAHLAAWIIALYPEAILLGSSQMREAFTIPLATASFYGLLRYQQERNWKALVWMVTPVALYLPFSPPFAALMAAMLALSVLIIAVVQHKTIFRQRWLWAVLIVVAIIILAGLWLALRQFTPEGMNNPLAMASWWLRKSAYLQAHYSEYASGLIQYIFDRLPTWMHLPMLVAYGVAQPFLPAALVASSLAPIWPWITTLRAIGWTIMLVFLIYAPVFALSKVGRRAIQKQAFTTALILIVWIGILVASYRGGGDLWDNPRYRSIFAGLQSALVAWTWVMHRRHSTRWLRRILFGVAGFSAWLLPWYFRRYTAFTWPIEDILITLGLGFASALLLILWDWTRERSEGHPPDANPPDAHPPAPTQPPS